MLKIIFYIFTFILCAIGLCDILHSIWMFLVKPARKFDSFCIVFLDGADDYSVLFSVYEKMKWYGSDFCNRVIAVQCGDSDPFIREYFGEKGIIFKDVNSFDIGVLNEFRT